MNICLSARDTLHFRAFATASRSKSRYQADFLLRIMAEQKQLWEINDVVLNNNYSSRESGYGVYYSLATSRTDLPLGFYASER